MVVEVRTINIPHHLPKTKPENINNGIANPSIKTQIIEKTKNNEVKSKDLGSRQFHMWEKWMHFGCNCM